MSAKEPGPPHYLISFLRWFCPDHMLEETKRFVCVTSPKPSPEGEGFSTAGAVVARETDPGCTEDRALKRFGIDAKIG